MGGSYDDSNEMHRQVSWLTAADVRILEFLNASRDTAGRPAIHTPTTVAANTGFATSYAGERVRHLEGHDLVEKVKRGQYRLSDRGEALMDGSLRPEELEE